MVRGALRELHGPGRQPLALARPDPPRLPNGAPWCVPVDRLDRPARHDLSRRVEGSCRSCAADVDFRPSVLHRPARHEHARPAPTALYGGSAEPRRRSRDAGAGPSRPPPRARERVELRHLCGLRAQRVGVHRRARQTFGLRNPARCEQRLCQRLQPRIRRQDLPARHAEGTCAPVPPRRPRTSRHAHRRHARSPDRVRRVGALCRSRPAVPRRADHDRARRQHSALRGAAGGTRRGPAHCRAGAARNGAERSGMSIVSNAGSLADLQRAFQDYLLVSSDGFAAAVRDTRKIDRVTLLGVYRDAYTLRLIEVLTVDYPGVMAMAGPADFDYMARAYIAAHPSRHPSVRWFGRGLADFLAAPPPFNGSQAVIDMARFEWAMGDAFDGPDAQPIAADALMTLQPEAWETLSFIPVPSLQTMTLTFDVPQAWQRRDEQEPGNLEVEPAAQPTGWVVWRREFSPNFRSLDEDEAAALAVLADGRPFPEICESLVEYVGEDQAAARAAGLLRGWVEEGMIASFRS